MSASIGAPLSIGFFQQFSSDGWVRDLTYEIPLTIDLNYGYAALKRTSIDFGGFLGIGFGFYSLSQSFSSPSFDVLSSNGNVRSLYLHGGIRFVIDGFSAATISLFTYQTFNTAQVYGIRGLLEITDFK